MQLPWSGLRERNKHSKPVTLFTVPLDFVTSNLRALLLRCRLLASRPCPSDAPNTDALSRSDSSEPSARCVLSWRLLRGQRVLHSWSHSDIAMFTLGLSDYCSDSCLPFTTWALVSFAHKRGLNRAGFQLPGILIGTLCFLFFSYG